MKNRLLLFVVSLFMVANLYSERYLNYDVFYAVGGLVNGVKNWDFESKNYPIVYNESTGFYEGDVEFVWYDIEDAPNATIWGQNGWFGCRGDLFFVDPDGNQWGGGDKSSRFITPTTGSAGLVLKQNGANPVFQAMGGKWHITMDPVNQLLYAKPIDEVKWVSWVYVSGTTKNDGKDTWNDDDTSVRLLHVSDGIYTGTVELFPGANGNARFYIHASILGCFEARYCAPQEGVFVQNRETTLIPRLDFGPAFNVKPGRYEVTFNANNFTIEFVSTTLSRDVEQMKTHYPDLDYTFLENIALEEKTAPQSQLDKAHAYLQLLQKVLDVRSYLKEHADFAGEGRDKLETYLYEAIEPSETLYPRGTFLYIWDEFTLEKDEIANEILRIDQMLEYAIKSGITLGTNINHMLSDPELATGEGWNKNLNGGNCVFNIGSGNAMEMWNNTWFNIYQTVTDLPNGIYELCFNGYYRPGVVEEGLHAHAISGMIYMNNWDNTLPNILEGATLQPTVESDYLTDSGYVPNRVDGATAAFAAGRYAEKMYGVVTDGTLTFGLRHNGTYTYYGAWTVMGNLNMIYRGKSVESADAAIRMYEKRLERLDVAVESYYYKQLKSDVQSLLTKAYKLSNFDEKIQAIDSVNRLFTRVHNCIKLYNTTLTEVEKYVAALYKAAEAENADPSYLERANVVESFLNEQLWPGVLEGSYTDDEMLKIFNQYKGLWREFDVIYAAGGLLDTKNWEDTQKYPLKYNVQTHCYEGEVSFAPRYLGKDNVNGENQYGHRCDLYFTHEGVRRYWAGDAINRFITPTTGQRGMPIAIGNGGGTPFQCVGGTYRFSLNLETMTLHATVVNPGWLDWCFVGGNVKAEQPNEFINSNWDERLEHQGDGIYTGTRKLYGGDDGLAEFAIFCSTFGQNDAWYSCDIDSLLPEDQDISVSRYHNKKLIVPEGEYQFTFNIDAQLLRIKRIGDVTGGQVAKDVIYCRGGLAEVGNWAENDKYPLYDYGDGIYRGKVTFTDTNLTPETTWGNRADLFFQRSDGSTFGALNTKNHFITPTKNHFEGLSNGTGNVYQCLGGTYEVAIDLRNMKLDFKCIDEKWMEYVYVVGSIKDYWYAIQGAKLQHFKHGIYCGTYLFEENPNCAAGPGFAELFVLANIKDGNTNDQEGRYVPAESGKAEVGKVFDVGRYNGPQSVFVPYGEYKVVFDMNKETLIVEDPSTGIALPTFRGDEKVEAFTLDGKRVYEGQISKMSLSNGVYVIKGTQGSVKITINK